MVRRMLRVVAIAVAAIMILGAGWVFGRMGIGRVVEPDSLTDVERAFADRMRNVALVGTFSVGSREGRSPDRYEIASVEKIGDDLWRFNASMDCCGLDGATVPIAVPLRFVGDTPVIMMTDTELPGIGAFSVRLLFYGDRYAGTWQHGDIAGGLMSGRIEPQE